MLAEGSDEEILQTLTAVRGLGRWSVEMFMCFALKRMDVLSTGDLGVQYVLHFAFLAVNRFARVVLVFGCKYICMGSILCQSFVLMSFTNKEQTGEVWQPLLAATLRS